MLAYQLLYYKPVLCTSAREQNTKNRTNKQISNVIKKNAAIIEQCIINIYT